MGERKNFIAWLHTKRSVRFLVIGTRVFLGIIFLTAGLSKIMDFPVVIGPVWLEEKAAQYGLALFARFVAFSEAITGIMLLTRFATLGAVMLFPIQLCILMFTISLNWQGTPLVNAFLLLLNTGLLVYDWHKLKFLIMDQSGPAEQIPFQRKLPKLDVAWLTAFSIFISGMVLLKLSMDFRYLIYLGLIIMLGTPLAAKWSGKKN